MEKIKIRGFTLLEVLLVIALIAILAAIVIIAINPNRQLGQGRNTQRRTDVNTILQAVYQYTINNNGTMPTALDASSTTSQVLGTNTSGCSRTCTATTTEASCVDLSSVLVPTHIVGIPLDPTSGTATNTDYYINKDANGRLTVGSCDPEVSATINVSL